MNLKKAGSIICATGVLLSLAVPASAANTQDVSGGALLDASISRAIMDYVFKTGYTELTASSNVVGSGTAKDYNNICQVIFDNIESPSELKVTARIGSRTYQMTQYVTRSNPNVLFQDITIKNGDPVEISVQSMNGIVGVPSVRCYCWAG